MRGICNAVTPGHLGTCTVDATHGAAFKIKGAIATSLLFVMSHLLQFISHLPVLTMMRLMSIQRVADGPALWHRPMLSPPEKKESY